METAVPSLRTVTNVLKGVTEPGRCSSPAPILPGTEGSGLSDLNQ
jgi:hypothetical protein